MTYKEWKGKQDEFKQETTQKPQNDNLIKFNDITDSWTKKTKDGSYAECESITINGKTYNVGDNGVTLNINNRDNDIKVAMALSETYGKEVVLLPEFNGNNRYMSMPDLMVDGKTLEIKNITGTGKNTIKHNISSAKSQSRDVLLNICNNEIDVNNAIKTAERLFNDKQCDFMNSCILMKDGKIVKILERNKIGTAYLQKQGEIPIIDNITTKPIKSQLQNKEKNDKIYIRKAEVVDGKDLVGDVEYKGLLQAYYHGDPDALYAIDEVVEKQGFNGLPTIINDENELKKLTNADTLLGERTIRADNEKLFNQYCNDLLNDKFYINCATGGAQYGQGMYFASDYTKGKIKADKWQHEIDQYSGNAPFQKTYWLTLDKNIKKIDVNDIKKEYGKHAIKKLEKVWSKEKMTILKSEFYGTIGYDSNNTKPTGESYEKYKELFRKYKQQGKLKELRQIEDEVVDFLSKDVGVMATEMGYDMIEAKGHGTTGSYNVLLNRTKLIVIDKDIKAEEIEKVFGGK